MAASLPQPGKDCLLDPSAEGVEGGGKGGMENDSIRAPGWGEEVPALAGPGGREWRWCWFLLQ